MAGDTFWNDEKVAELRKLWVEDNLSGTQIAVALGLKDRNAVMGKIHRLGITRKIVGATEGDVAARAKTPKHADDAGPATPVPASPPAASEAPPVVPEAPPSPPVVPEPPAEPEAFSGHPVMQLKERSCRWPIGDPQHPTFRFCCAERLGTFPYCAEHAEISYVTPDRHSRRAPVRAKAA